MIGTEDSIQTSKVQEIPSPLKSSVKTKRFTLDGSDELERQLARTCATILDQVRKITPDRKLEALLLGGGYGRGEGGVLITETGDRPYNDLEFYVLIRGNHWLNERRYHQAFFKLAHKLTPAAGIEIEFKILSLAKLRRSPPSMFYHDLVMGHRWLWGDENLLVRCEHHRDARQIPLSEATRLLMNRCSGLLFAREKLRHELTVEDADFIGRNLAKAQLAFGDAVLTVLGQYHWSCRERHRQLKQLVANEAMSWLPEVRRHHAAGLHFKLHPRRTTATVTLQTQLEEISTLAFQLWIWLENRRLGCVFRSARDYALSPENKCPETNPWRNRLVNAKVFGPGALFRMDSNRHPRERLLNALALLLLETQASDSELLNHLRKQLRWPSKGTMNPVEAYQTLWRRFN